MGCCCGKKKSETEDEGSKRKGSSNSGKKGTTRDSTTDSLSQVQEYKFNSPKDQWNLSDPKAALEPETMTKLEKKVEFQSATKREAPDSDQITNVILFDPSTGSEIYKKAKENPNLLTPGSSASKRTPPEPRTSSKDAKEVSSGRPQKQMTGVSEPAGGEQKSPAPAIKPEFFKTKVNGVEKVAVVFSSDKPVSKQEMQQALSNFMDNVQKELPQVFPEGQNKKVLGFASDSGRPTNKAASKSPRRDHKPAASKYDFEGLFNKTFAKYFEPGPGHITLPKSPKIEELPGFSQVKPGWLNVNNIYYFIIMIERTEGAKYLGRLRSNPATSHLLCETQGEFFQCEYAGLEMVGLRLFHPKNDIMKIDRAQRALLMDNMKDIKPVAIRTDFDYREDPFDIVNCCNRLELKEDVKNTVVAAC